MRRECASHEIYYSRSFFLRAMWKRTREGSRDPRRASVTIDQGNDPADRTYIMQRTIATLEIRFARLRLSQGVGGRAFPGHLKSKAFRTIDGCDAGSVNYQNSGSTGANLIYMNDVK